MKIVDLTIKLEEGLPSDPPMQIPKITRLDHKTTAEQMSEFFEGATKDDLPGGNGWAIDFLEVCTHAGTHLDAPWHYYPTQNGGEDWVHGTEKAWTIDEVPLEWCIGRGVKVDFRDKPDGYRIMAKDFEDYFKSINYEIQPGDIVLLNTGASARWGKVEYLVAGCGVSMEATNWLTERGVHVVGTDGWSWDVPLPFEGKMFKETGDASVIWEGHRAGAVRAYCHIEKLTNLEALPVTGYTVYALPIPVKGGSAGWSRVIAILDEE